MTFNYKKFSKIVMWYWIIVLGGYIISLYVNFIMKHFDNSGGVFIGMLAGFLLPLSILECLESKTTPS